MPCNNLSKVLLLLCPLAGFAGEQTKYCPGNHSLVRIGMNTDQVLNACGQPASVKTSNISVSKKIPVTQLIYSNLNTGGVFMGWDAIYNMWSLPSGSSGMNIQVNLIDDKVKSFNVNGQSTNALNLCNNGSVKVGDDINDVYSACGSPSLVNNSFINEPVPDSAKPEVWTYQPDPYRPSFRLPL